MSIKRKLVDWGVTIAIGMIIAGSLVLLGMKILADIGYRWGCGA